MVRHSVVALLLLSLSVPAFAGIGFHVVSDMTTIGAEATNFSFEGDASGHIATLGREESASLLGGGIDLTFGMLPVVDLMLTVDGTYGMYKTYYSTTAPGIEPLEDEIPYLRAGADLTGLVELLSLPPLASVLSLSVGAGPSFMVQAPIFSQDLVKENFASAEEAVDPAALVDDIVMKPGLHFAARAKISPPNFPISLRLTGKYYIIPGVDDPNLSQWLSVSAGIGFGL